MKLINKEGTNNARLDRLDLTQQGLNGLLEQLPSNCLWSLLHLGAWLLIAWIPFGLVLFGKTVTLRARGSSSLSSCITY